MYTDKISKAIVLAAINHKNQYRKNPEKKIPYIVHPLSVGMMLDAFGFSEDVIIAGILHDTIEDTSLTLDEIRKEFGDEIAGFIWEVSEHDKSLSWEERKAKYIAHLKEASLEAKAISCCDKIYNMKSLMESLNAGENMWQKLRKGKEAQIERFTKMFNIFKDSLKQEMVKEYGAVLEQLKTM